MKKFFIGIFIILLLAIGVFFFVENRDSKTISKKYDGFTFISEGKDIDSSDFDRIDGQFYLSLDYIKEYIDEDIIYDEEEKTVILTNREGTKYLPLDGREAVFNNGKVELRSPVIEKEGKIMLPIEAFIYDYDVNLRYDQDRQLLLLDRNNIKYATGTVKKDAVLREDAESNSSIIKKVKKDEELYVYGEEGKYYRVRQLEGVAGYIKKEDLKVNFSGDKFQGTIQKNENNKEAKKPLNLTWDYTYGNQSDESVEKIEKINGLNTICPTWFSIRNNEGDLVDRGNLNYVQKYRSLGIDVWGYLDNSFDKEITHNALKSPKTRNKIIGNALELCKKYGMKGINIDFEDIYIDDRDKITQFVKELSSVFRKEGILVSVDVTPQISTDVTKEPYDRKELAKVCDYVIVMTYDQHWGSSDTAGSVAQYKWVEGSINVLFRNIPNDKMVLGIPLYSRLWVEENGKVKSSTISMGEINNLIQERNLKPQWDKDSRQNYVEYQDGGKVYKIWIEDYKSIEHKASLVNKYHLGGVGTWRRGFETKDIWDAIDKQLSYRKTC